MATKRPTKTQCLAALARANKVRSKRADLKADLKAGRVLLADVLFSEADYLQSMKVRDLLLAAPKIGPAKAHRALQACWLSPTVSLEKTSRKSRQNLLAWIAVRHPCVVGLRQGEAACS